MIVFDRVYFSYGSRTILNGLSFSIGPQERVAILGGSGEGKTTILKLIMGLIKPDSGIILVDGEDITIKSEAHLREVRLKFSIVFQEGALFDSLNVKENVAFCLREYTKMTEEEIDGRVRELLRVVGMEHAIGLMPDELSGGMHRRVAIARSLAAYDPLMFLYDEPTAGLDPISADTICRLILDLAGGGRGLIMVTHKVSDALKVAGRFMFLKEGRVLFDGDRENLVRTALPEIRMFMSELECKLTKE
ncbi:MAG: ATP-binding cassette domain-containing protein [Alphaproteobacteria bacterium]|uniref:ATP-binding cassette domain-containing protein n=1 Tax=Candidatus Nitrobium versatile TaxID=2884831 RepID=A0A953M0P7_9BACT|nr:ATP-binding cassette domain-containing protein [Candidatus Nitrobium versatile]